MIRSLFFAPANRHDLIAKFPRFKADCYAIDLEDGTPQAEKDAARQKLCPAVEGARSAGVRGCLFVRVNDPTAPQYLDDLKAAVLSGADGIIIPKLERPDHLFPALHLIEHAERSQRGTRPIEIMAGLESIRGVINAMALCAADKRVTSVYFGAEDFASDMGARRTAGSDEVLYARSQVVLAAKAAQVIAIDQAVVNIRDDDQCRRDAEKGRDLGYDGKICLLPRQLEICNEVFSPSPDEVQRAREIMEAYREAQRAGIGTIDFKGQMIDGPLLKRAEAVVAFADSLNARA